ncbi:MAG: hypothetical protein ACI9RO_002327 [Alteromonas macleodii]|jgi:hypothetical protein
MPTIVIVTTLCATLLHTCWNALAKGAADKHLSMAGVSSAICRLPLLA